MFIKMIKPGKEAFVLGMLSAAGQVLVSEAYRNYVELDPLSGIRQKVKIKQRKKSFDKIMAQTNLKEELA